MTVDPDAEDGPDPAWYRSELDACRARIAALEAENARLLADLDLHRGPR